MQGFRFLHPLKNKLHLLSLICCWALVQCALLYFNGINADGESLRFLREAENLNAGKAFSTPVYFFYLTEISLIALVQLLKLHFGWIIAVQIGLNAFATIRFYRFLDATLPSKSVVFFSTLALIVCWPYQIYNCFLYTESIFFSLSILFSIYLFQLKKMDFSNAIVLLLFLILLCITRPAGLFFVLATIIYSRFILTKNWKLTPRFSLIIVGFFITFLILNNVMGSGEGVNILLPFQEEHVICDIPLHPNANISSVEQNNSIFGLIQYCWTHPTQFASLAIKKTIAFWGLVRTYYSTAHNFMLCLFFYPLFLVILLSSFKHRKKLPFFAYFIFPLMLIFWLAVVCSCDEWHNRFFLTLTPFIILMAAHGITNFITEQHEK